MFRKLIAIGLISLLVQMTYARPATASTKAEEDARIAEQVRAGIAKLGTGKEATLKVKLRDGTKLAGYVSEANETSFVIVDPKPSVSSTVAYPDVTQVKGNNLSSGAWFAIGIGVLLGIGLLMAVALRGH